MVYARRHVGERLGVADAVLRSLVLLADDALELGGDVVHQCLVKRNAGVKLSTCGGECIVGIAACCKEVVGDDRIGCLCVKRLAVYAVDGNAVYGLGTVVGRAGIGRVVCVICLGCINGVVYSGNLGEAADRTVGRAVGRSLKSLEQLCTGDIDNGDGVAEGQNGVYVLLGDVAGLDRRADAAAVCDCNNVLLVNRHAAGLFDRPYHGVGDKVAEVSLAVAVAVEVGLGIVASVAVELDLALCEDGAVLGVDSVGDVLSCLCNRLVLCRVFGHFDEHVLFDLLGGIVNNNNADIFKCGAGGLDRLVIIALFHNGVGVAVDDEVNAGETCPQVGRAVGLAFGINAQVRQNNDNVGAVGLKLIGLGLNCLDHVIACEPGQTLYEGWVCLGLAFGRVDADEADLQAVNVKYLAAFECGLAVFVEDVAADGAECRFLEVFLELSIAVVKLVVAEGGDVVACRVHHLDRVQALVRADLDLALAEVACVGNYYLGTMTFILRRKCSHVCIAGYRTVNVVRVYNNGFACHRRGLPFCECRNRQSEYHGDDQKQRKEFLGVFHIAPPDKNFSVVPM